MPTVLATWNVNSIRARLGRVLDWLAARRPDIACLQETKVADADFPFDELRAAGYVATTLGQKTYNGVAILSRQPPSEVLRGFDDGLDETQSRFLVATLGPVRVASVYVPNGQAVGSEKFVYKLEWLARWRRWLEVNARAGAPLILCGDFNIAPEDIDVHDPVRWRDQVLCHPQERAALARIRAAGFEDTFRHLHPNLAAYSWWDYRQLSFPRNEGLRIDHVYCPPSWLAEGRCRGIVIDRETRKGKLPSDHAPVIAELDLDAPFDAPFASPPGTP